MELLKKLFGCGKRRSGCRETQIKSMYNDHPDFLSQQQQHVKAIQRAKEVHKPNSKKNGLELCIIVYSHCSEHIMASRTVFERRTRHIAYS
mmetsp:Transcript_37526/g.78662  ORF Transcript_37526/g.78662 Transcript_37526/m.78662 type:complete len:91 (+) Transcript_37526:499-771(+)